MNILINKRYLLDLLYMVFWGVVITGCSNDDQFKLGEDLVNVKSNLALLDTFTLEMSTVKMDSVQTSGVLQVMAGKYNDGDLGITEAQGFERLTPQSYSYNLSNECVYDSICFIARLSGYYYGDTSVNSSIRIHEVTENLNKFSNNVEWYNYEKVNYSDKVLGEKAFKPKPQRHDRLSIRLDNSFGSSLFDSIYNQSVVFYTEENFVRFFKGIALVPGSENSCVLQFDSVQVNLYYHAGTEHSVFTLNSNYNVYNNYQFTHVSVNYNGLPLSALTSQKTRLSSIYTNNKAYIQGSTGIMLRIDIPSFKALKQTATYMKIMKAQLLLCPVKNTYRLTELPQNLYLYSTNDRNQTVSLFTDSKGYALEADLYVDDQFNLETSYSFDITSYISYIFSLTTDDEIPSLLVTVPSDIFSNTLNRVIIGNSLHPTNPSKLKIFYWYINDKQ